MGTTTYGKAIAFTATNAYLIYKFAPSNYHLGVAGLSNADGSFLWAKALYNTNSPSYGYYDASTNVI